MTGSLAAPRPLHPADAPAARELVRASLGNTSYVERVLELLAMSGSADPDSEALIAARDGTVAGLALFGTVAGTRDTWKLHIVLVGDHERLREIGDSLLDAVLRRVTSLRGRILVAELPADPAYGGTLSLLRANDFDQVGRIADYFRDDVALLFLRREL